MSFLAFLILALGAVADDMFPPLSFPTQPTSQTVEEGGTAVFIAQANGPLPLTFAWYRNDVLLKGYTNQTLTLAGVSKQQAGTYRIVVRNAGGQSLSSDPAILTVRDPIYPRVVTIAGTFPEKVETVNPQRAYFYPSPFGLTVDSTGNIYVAVASGIQRLAPNGRVTVVAGSVSFGSLFGYVDANGTNARFRYTYNLGLDPAGNLIVADTDNHRIRKVLTADPRPVSTIAGNGSNSLVDGGVATASFYSPNAVVVDAQTNIFVADYWNHAIRRISSGLVYTIAGNGTAGSKDGEGTAATFYGPTGITLDGVGNLYVSDNANHNIRKITPIGTVTTLAGPSGALNPNTSYGFVNGKGNAARFNSPGSLVADAGGTIYVCDQGNYAIRKITPDGNVTTLIGGTNAPLADGDALTARLGQPRGIAFHPNGSLIISDDVRIRQIFLSPTNAPAINELNLDLKLYPGLGLTGVKGSQFRIEAAENAIDGPWIAVTNITLLADVVFWTDPQPANLQNQKTYRAVRTD